MTQSFNESMVQSSHGESAVQPIETESVRRLPPKNVVRALTLAALVVGSVFAGRNLARWPVCLRYPGELDGVEGGPLAEMVHLRSGVPIYARASGAGFDAAAYGPLYYLLGARLVDPASPSHYFPRLVSLVASLGCATASALLAFRLSQSFFAALLAPLFFLGFGHVAALSPSSRSDMMALLLVFSGFLVAHRFRSGRALLLACPLLLAGFFYKQQFAAAPLAIFTFLAAEKRYRLAGEFVALMSIAGLALVALFQFVVFAGQAFILHLTTYSAVPFSLYRFVFFVVFFVLTLAPLLLAGIDSLRLHHDKLVACYLACAVFLALMLLAKEGSGTTYFIETTLVLSPLLAVLVAHRIRSGQELGAVELLALLTVALWLAETKVMHFRPRAEDFTRDRTLQTFLYRAFPPGAAALGDHSGDLIRAGLATPISNLSQYSWLVCGGRLPDADLVAQIRMRRFAVILLTADLRSERDERTGSICWTESLRRAILESYRLERVFPSPPPYESSHYYAWVPRPENDERGMMNDEGGSWEPEGGSGQ